MWTVKTNFVTKWENRNIGNQNQRKKWNDHRKHRNFWKIVTFTKQFILEKREYGKKLVNL